MGAMTRYRTAGFAALATLVLGGCISLGAKVPPQLLTLTAEQSAPAGAAASGRLADAIVVLEPETDQRLAVPRVPVQVDDASVAYLKDATWVERPARLLQNLLAETLRAKGGGRLVFTGNDINARGASLLNGRLTEMGYDARSRSVVVRFDAMRQSTNGTVATRRFEVVEENVAPKAQEVGPALNKAANAVATQVADWVAG
ncbi:MAG: ABC-type transport auxiliary lipoprotein family protein [Methanolinea sp.]